MVQAQALLFRDILEIAVMFFHHLKTGNNMQMARNPLPLSCFVQLEKMSSAVESIGIKILY